MCVCAGGRSGGGIASQFLEVLPHPSDEVPKVVARVKLVLQHAQGRDRWLAIGNCKASRNGSFVEATAWRGAGPCKSNGVSDAKTG